MHRLKSYLLLLTLCLALQGIAQPKSLGDSNTINRLLEEAIKFLVDDTAKSINLSLRARDISRKINYKKGEAYANKNIGRVYYMQARYVETLDHWNESLRIFTEIKDEVGMSNLLNNIGAIYFAEGVDDKALEYCLKALKYGQNTGDTLRILSALTTIGSIYYNKKDPVALDYLLQALPLNEKLGDKDSYVIIAGNIGEIYYDNKAYEKALQFYRNAINADKTLSNTSFAFNGIGKVYLKQGKPAEALMNHNKALAIAEKMDDKLQVIRSLRGVADIYAYQNKNIIALEYYNKARQIGEKVKANVELQDLYPLLATSYSKTNDFNNAYLYQSKYADIKDTLYKDETRKKLGKLQFDFDLSKKEGEINLLTKEKSLKEVELKAQKQAKTGLAIGLILIIIIAFIIFRNYLQQSKTNKVLDKQKVEIEQLLLNILPQEVASELQAKGYSKPRHFEDVSVLFTDFKGFTSIADKLSPAVVVEQLNECFMAFDNIIDKYGLEKIKTIGDAYMCAGNIPSPNPNHSYKIIKAGLEILDFINDYNAQRHAEGLEPWEIRVGIHIGPVVAGVVGKKKYAYDIWGSTVNIASRMESNGDPGRVNISAVTHEIIKNDFACSYRGKIQAKNLGDIDMYFVDYEITHKKTAQKEISKEENVA